MNMLSRLKSEGIHVYTVPSQARTNRDVWVENIMAPSDYELFPSVWGDSTLRRWNLWGYVDERDVAAACRQALAAPAEAVAGSPSFIIAAADTVMNRPSHELMAEVYPSVPYRKTVGEYDTLLSIDKARSLLGYEPQHSWRDNLTA